MKNIDRTVILTVTNESNVIYTGDYNCNYDTTNTHIIRELVCAVLGAAASKDNSVNKTKSAFIRRCILNIARIALSNYPTNSASDNEKKVYDAEVSYRFAKIKVTAQILQTTTWRQL